MNGYTKTPVNTVFFTCSFAILLGLLAFAGPSAINAVFSLSTVALYIAYGYVPFLINSALHSLTPDGSYQGTHCRAFPW